LAALCLETLDRGRLLEIGCGSGLVYQELGPPLSDGYVGVDVSRAMLGIAKQRSSGANLILADGYDLPFKDKEFRSTVAFEVLGHLPALDRILREMVRVTASTVIFTLWDEPQGPAACEVGQCGFLYFRYPERDVHAAIRAVIGLGASTERRRVFSSILAWIVRLE
jgi:ubiquinone/menaquinone biosynthesis C-methylase UbiE